MSGSTTRWEAGIPKRQGPHGHAHARAWHAPDVTKHTSTTLLHHPTRTECFRLLPSPQLSSPPFPTACTRPPKQNHPPCTEIVSCSLDVRCESMCVGWAELRTECTHKVTHRVYSQSYVPSVLTKLRDERTHRLCSLQSTCKTTHKPPPTLPRPCVGGGGVARVHTRARRAQQLAMRGYDSHRGQWVRMTTHRFHISILPSCIWIFSRCPRDNKACIGPSEALSVNIHASASLITNLRRTRA